MSKLLLAATTLWLILATHGAQASEKDLEFEALASAAGCKNRFSEVKNLVALGNINTLDRDFQAYMGTYTRNLISRRPDGPVSTEELIETFISQVVEESASVFPARNRLSTRSEITRALVRIEESGARAGIFEKPDGAAGKLIRASLKLRSCLLINLSVPSLKKLRDDFVADVSQRGCSAQYDRLIRRVPPENRDTVSTFLGVQGMPYDLNINRDHEVEGYIFRKRGNNFYSDLDDLARALAALKRADNARRGATLQSQIDWREIETVKNEVARLDFWSCYLVSDEVRQDARSASPQLNFPQFVERVADDGSSVCDLSSCFYEMRDEKLMVICNKRAECTPRKDTYSREAHATCPSGAWKLKQAQLDAYFEADAKYLPMLCQDIVQNK